MKKSHIVVISLNEKIFVVIVSDIVAVIVALDVFDQSLEVEVGQLVHHTEHDVLKEFIIDLWSTGKHLDITPMLGQTSVQNGIVLIVGINDSTLKPLVIAIANEALSRLEMLGAVHFSVTAIVGTKGLILTNGVL